MIVAFGWLLHPLRANAASFWGGIAGDIGELAIIGGLIAMVRHHNCAVKGCWKMGHIDPAHSHPACRRHHSQADKIGD